MEGSEIKTDSGVMDRPCQRSLKIFLCTLTFCINLKFQHPLGESSL